MDWNLENLNLFNSFIFAKDGDFLEKTHKRETYEANSNLNLSGHLYCRWVEEI